MNRAKLKTLVHYVIAKSDPSHLGAIRLNKILWFADSIAYRATGASISGETYIKRQLGPVPKHILATLGELEHENAIVIKKRDLVVGHPMTEYIALTDPDISALSAQEIAIVESMRELICNRLTAMEVSAFSHDVVWQAANVGEEIPLAATLAGRTGEVSAEVQSWADKAIARYQTQIAA
jgi:hypothetical protein